MPGTQERDSLGNLSIFSCSISKSYTFTIGRTIYGMKSSIIKI